jgi:predicted DNA-binding transcriptional regulator AlpA
MSVHEPVTDRLVQVTETMSLLGCSRQSLYRWRDAGLLVPVKLVGGVRYRQSDILRVIAEGLPAK